MLTLLEQILTPLGVRFTKSYATAFYWRHAHRNNLWGVSQMLGAYKVKNTTIMVDDKERLHELATPFVAGVADGLAVVREVSDKDVSLVWNGEIVNVPREAFLQSWTGVSLLLETSDESGEPHYKEHRKSESFVCLQKLVLAGSILVISAFGALCQLQFFSWRSILVCLLTALGAFVAYLLTMDGRTSGVSAVDKVCSLFSKGNCPQVRQSHNVTLCGFQLSEIGLSFFVASLLLQLTLPAIAMHWLPWVFCMSVPFTMWSLWTQGVRMKAWCPLCVATVVILWALVATTVCELTIAISLRSALEIPVVCAFYASMLVGIHWFLAYGKTKRELTEKLHQLNSFKVEPSVLNAMLNSMGRTIDIRTIQSVELRKETEKQLPTITIVGNPYCNPCARMHKRLTPLFEAGFGIRYVWTVFEENHLQTVARILAFNGTHDPQEVWTMLGEWYEAGRNAPASFWKSKGVDDTLTIEYMNEARLHWQCCLGQGLISTPTVFVENMQLPEVYAVEDLLNLDY